MLTHGNLANNGRFIALNLGLTEQAWDVATGIPRFHRGKVGLPDVKFGESVAVWVRVRPGEQLTAGEIRQFCEGSIANGTIQKYRMREMEIHELGLEEAAKVQTA